MARVGLERYGDWEKLSTLGSGGFGQVSLWQNVNDGTKIAIKMCKQQLGDRSLERWKLEVDIMKSMKHESIVGFHEVPKAIQDNYVINYVALGMEYCEMGDLRRMLGKAKNCCGIQEFQVRDFLDNIGSAIHFLHGRSIVHRDLKPENIVMKSMGNEKIQFKIIDLGYAKDLSEQSCGTSFVGTLHYLAPEFSSVQSLRYTKTVDFWSFGLVAFECITGRRPFFPHLEAMQFISILRENKLDEHICTVGGSNDQTPRYLSHIPQPHALNPVFADKIGMWLQKMLLMDATRRGGGDGNNGWFRNLQEILAEKHINAYNTQTYTTITMQANPGMSIQGMQQQVFAETNIPIESQVLLLKNGETPNVMRPAVNECWRIPSNDSWNVYLYSGEDFQVPNLKMPSELESIISGRRVHVQPKEIRRILCLSINFVSSNCKRCLEAVSALRAIKSSVHRHYSHFSASGEELKKSYYKFHGIVGFFRKSLKTDVDHYENQFEEDDNQVEDWTRNERAIDQYTQHELPVIKSTIEKANVFNSRINVDAHVKQAEEFCINTTRSLAEREQQSSQKFDEIKKKIRAYQESCRRSERDASQLGPRFIDGAMTPNQKLINKLSNKASLLISRVKTSPSSATAKELFRMGSLFIAITHVPILATMKDLANNFLQPIAKEISQHYVNTSSQIRILLKYLKELRRVMGETNFADKTYQLNCHIKSLLDLNEFRQESIWGLVRKLKAETEEMYRLMNAASESAYVENINNDPERPESIRLTDEMDLNVRQFDRFINELTREGSDSEIYSLNWDSLLADSASRMVANPPADNDHPPTSHQANHAGGAVPQVALNVNTNNNNSNDSIEVSPEIVVKDQPDSHKT